MFEKQQTTSFQGFELTFMETLILENLCLFNRKVNICQRQHTHAFE